MTTSLRDPIEVGNLHVGCRLALTTGRADVLTGGSPARAWAGHPTPAAVR